MISMFLVGFVPGFYLSYLFLTKTVKKHNPYYILLYFIIGIVFGFIGFVINVTLSFMFHFNNIYWKFLDNALPYIVLGEILIVAMHFFFFEKRKKKRKK